MKQLIAKTALRHQSLDMWKWRTLSSISLLTPGTRGHWRGGRQGVFASLFAAFLLVFRSWWRGGGTLGHWGEVLKWNIVILKCDNQVLFWQDFSLVLRLSIFFNPYEHRREWFVPIGKHYLCWAQTRVTWRHTPRAWLAGTRCWQVVRRHQPPAADDRR